MIDITERKMAEEHQVLLMRELDHRAKNALAVVHAAVRLTPKDDVSVYAQAIEGRVKALARAHSMLAEARWEGAELRALLQGELAPFVAGQRAELSGPPVALASYAAQGLAMVVHELATNAVKHGALSTPTGRVSVNWSVESALDSVGLCLHLRWAEEGGPAVSGPPDRRGFGARVLDATVRTQLCGKLHLHWARGGLACEMEVPLRRLPGLLDAHPGVPYSVAAAR